TWTLSNYRQLADGYGVRLIGFTVAFGLTVATATTVLAYGLAMFVRSLPRRSQWVAMVLLLLPKSAGLLAVIFGLQRWLPRGLVSAVLAEVYLILPYAVLILFVQLTMLDRTLEDAARGLGASRWQVFRRITLPLSFRGIVVAFQLSLVWGLGAFLGPVF